MAADYLTSHALAQSVGFYTRVWIAAVQTAIDVLAEATDTPNHTNRAAFANMVLRDPQQWTVDAIAFGVACDPTITSGSSDAAIFSRTAAIWNGYSGVL